MKILYGSKNYIDVTTVFLRDDYISIPAGNIRLQMIQTFQTQPEDPDVCTVKDIVILHDDGYFITISANCSLYSHVKYITPSSGMISATLSNSNEGLIKANLNGNYGFDPQKIYDFSPFLERMKGISLYYGFTTTHTDTMGDTNFKVQLDIETPNMLYSNLHEYGERAKHFDLILQLCPWTCEFLNKRYNTNKFKCIFFPVQFYPLKTDHIRDIDVLYIGHYFNFKSPSIIPHIERIVRSKLGDELYNKIKNLLSIHSTDTVYNKLDILGNTKICIAQNRLTTFTELPGASQYIDDQMCIDMLPWHDGQDDYVPQIKSRCFEGGLMGCILLVYKNKNTYNIIERYFTENEDFLYFTDEVDLNNKIDMILADYDSYKYLAVNARNKVLQNYTLEHLVDKILRLKI
jgi:hypothetical protein